jgi:pumilio RNA-binding family
MSSFFLDHGSSEERLRVMRTVQGRIVQLAQHKYASNVVEKCVEKSGEADRRIVVLVSQRVGRQENIRLGESESKEIGE